MEVPVIAYPNSEDLTWIQMPQIMLLALNCYKFRMEWSGSDHQMASEDDHKPSQAELALASPAIKYFWLLRHQLVVWSGVVYYQRVE